MLALGLALPVWKGPEPGARNLLSVTEPGAVSFTLSDVRAALRADAFARGEAYARGGHVTDLTLSNGGTTIAARVRGSQRAPYQVTVYVARARSGRTIVSGRCTCPIGSDCKHVAATLLAALDGSSERARVHGTTTGTPPLKHPRAVVESDPRVDVWLAVLRENFASATAEVAAEERVAYLFTETVGPVSQRFPVEIVVTRLTKGGHWTKVRNTTAELLAAATARAVAPEDAIVGRFLQIYERSDRGRAQFAEDILRRIIATGRSHFADLHTAPLALGPARPAHLAWKLDRDGTQRPVLSFEDIRTVALPTPAPWYVEPETGVAGPVEAGLPSEALGAFLAAPPLAPAQAERVRDALAKTAGIASLPPPLAITERVERVDPVPVLRLRTIELDAVRFATWRENAAEPERIDIVEWFFEYGDVAVDPASAEREVRALQGADSVVYIRSQKAEDRAAARLARCGLLIDAAARQVLRASAICLRFAGEREALWPSFVHLTVQKLRAEGWRIEIDASFRHRVVDGTVDDRWEASASESKEADGWFDVAIGLDVDGRRIDLLPILRDLTQRADAYAQLMNSGPGDPFYITLQDIGTTVAFPAARLKAILTTLVELGDAGALRRDGALRLPRSRAAVVDALEANTGLRTGAPERLRELGTRLRSFSGVARVDVPASFHGELRPYQRDGLDWLQFLASYGFGGILADDMGLGKSVQALAHVLCEKESGRLTQPALLVVPTSLVFNWRDEAARFAPSLRVLALHGPARAAHFDAMGEHDLVMTTYALLVRDAVLLKRDWHAVILDEAQALKNPLAKAAQAAMQLRAAHRLCLTGTPVENHLGDLWSLFSIALPGALGDRKQFGRVFRTPIEKRGDSERKRVLAERIAPFLLRRTKEAVASELPEKTEIVQRVELTGAQRDLYETVRLAMHRRVREEIAQRGLARSQIVILDALLKLRQVCCDPRLLPPRMRKDAESVKLALLLEMLPQMIEEGRRVLVFSQFTSMLDLIVPAFEAQGIEFGMLTGQTKDRATAVAQFQSGKVPVFLISLKAGGTGLNLTAADTVVHYDPWWNPAVERQATDRAHRIGQTQHVFVYKLIAAGTVEEKIVELQARKAQLAAAIFSERAAGNARFAVEDVERLFAPLEV